jgi:hypothetical protein
VAAEFLTFGSRLNDRSAVRNEVMKMGFDWYFVEGNGLFKRIEERREMLTTTLNVLKNHTPSTLSARCLASSSPDERSRRARPKPRAFSLGSNSSTMKQRADDWIPRYRAAYGC